MNLLILLILLILFLLILLIYLKNNNKEFYVGIFGTDVNTLPKNCQAKNNCFPGSYFRSQLYNNMCQPECGKLNRLPIQLNDNCLKTLEY